MGSDTPSVSTDTDERDREERPLEGETEEVQARFILYYASVVDGGTVLQVSNEETTVHDHGLDISLVGNQEALSHVVDEYTDAGVPMVLRTISDYRGPSGVPNTRTDRQREVVRTAYEMGYYEIPRQVRTEEVAAEFGLDRSTVSEHLQRAERNLLRNVLGAD